MATYRIHQENLSFLKKRKQIKEFFYWIKKNKTKLTKEDYLKIRNKIYKLEFINLRLTKSFLIHLFILLNLLIMSLVLKIL